MSIRVMTEVWDNGPEDQTEAFILLALADHANDHGIGWPTIDRIAHKCRSSKSTVIRTLKKLQDDGWLEVEKFSGGDHRRNRYRIILTRFKIGVKMTPIPEDDFEIGVKSGEIGVKPETDRCQIDQNRCQALTPQPSFEPPKEEPSIEPPTKSAFAPQPKKLEIGKALIQLFRENFTRVDQLIHIRSKAKEAAEEHGYDTVMATAPVWIENNRTHPGVWPIRNFLNSKLLRDGGVRYAVNLPSVPDATTHRVALAIHNYSDGYMTPSAAEESTYLRGWIAQYGEVHTLAAMKQHWDRNSDSDFNKSRAWAELLKRGELGMEALANHAKDLARMESEALRRVEEERARLVAETAEQERREREEEESFAKVNPNVIE